MDYSFFLLLADRIDDAVKGANPQEAKRLSELRERLVTLTSEWDQARAAEIERVHRQIDELLQAEEIEAAIRRVLPEISELLLSLLAGRAQAARKAGEEATAARLEELLDRILSEVRAAAPPEVQFINEMLECEDETTMRAALEQRREEITPAVLELLKEMVGEMRTAGRKTIAGRLQELYGLATQVVG